MWKKKKSTFSPGFRVSLCFLTSHRFSCQKHSIQPLVQQLPPHSRQVVKTSKAIIRQLEVALCVLHTLSHGSCVVVGLRGGSQDPCWEGRCTGVAPAPLPSLPAPPGVKAAPVPAETAWDETTLSERLSDVLLALLAKIMSGRGQFPHFKTTFSGRDEALSQEPKLWLDLNSTFA